MISSLKLQNFRCFRDLSLDFSSRHVVLSGANGQGKTSILESIFFLANLRSFRTARVQELHHLGTEQFYIRSKIQKKSYFDLYEIEHSSRVRHLKISGQPVPKASDFAGAFNTIAFLPDDPQIITGASQLRRRFFDMFISMMDRNYFYALQQYSKALRERNVLLRTDKVNMDIVTAWNEILAEYGSRIVQHRNVYSKMLSDFMQNLLVKIRPELSNFQIRMKSGKGLDQKSVFLEKLKNQWQRDKISGFTLCGPHADDFEFITDDKSLRTFGSRGQCRIVSLVMKLAELDIVGTADGGMNSSVVLIDDATGDLDRRAKDSFYEKTLSAGQIFHAVTDAAESLNSADTQIIPVTTRS